MLPISLEIQGFYSYKEKQVIDFTTLTNRGIFGIFGNVGSGKSAILDAITFALYKRVYRKVNAYDIMNRDSSEILIKFVFRHDGREYQSIVKAIKNPKKETATPVQRFELKIDGFWTPIIDRKAEQIIGLDFDNFTRSIIIPQDKFSDFISLSNSKRSEMMAKVFQLEKYEKLKEINKDLSVKNKTELAHITGQLQTLNKDGLLSHDTIQQLSDNLQSTQQKIIKLDKQLEEHKKTFETLQQTKKLLDELQQNKDKLQKLLPQKSHINSIKTELNDFRVIKRHYAQTYQDIQSAKHEVQTKTNTSLSLDDQLTQQAQILHQVQQDHDGIAQIAQQKVQQLQLVDQLNAIKELRSLQAKIPKAQQQHQASEHQLQKAQTQRSKRSEQKNRLDQKIKKLSQPFRHLDIAPQLIQFYRNLADLNQQVLHKKEEKDKIKTFIKELKGKVAALGINVPAQSKLSDIITTSIQNTKQQIQELTHKSDQLRVKKQLSQYAINLQKNGGECPVCGSTHHPNLHSQDKTHQELIKIESQIQKLTTQKEKLEKYDSDIKTKAQIFRALGKETEALQTQIQQTKQDIQQLEAKGLNLQDANQIVHQHQNQQKEIQTKERDRHKIEQEINQLDQQIQQINQQKEAHRIELNTLETQLDIHQKAIQTQTLRQYQSQSIEELQKIIKSIQETYKGIDQKLEHSQAQLQEAQDKKTILNTQKKMTTSELQDLQKKLTHLQKVWQDLLQQEDYTEEYIHQMLRKQINEEEQQQKINQYQQQLHNIEQCIADQEAKLEQMQSFDPALYQSLEDQINTTTKEKNDLIESKGSIKTALQQLKKDIKIQEELQSKGKELQQRMYYLDELSQLFKGGQFVNYISSIYIKDLLIKANQKFAQLSDTRLKIIYQNDKTGFEIQEPGGNTRKILTLSGGQIFQASLALALALSDHIQYHNQHQKFFFIDEGFGTQDKESLQNIIQTLQTLVNDNYIIGLISHVEELQQDIQPFLKIQYDPIKDNSTIQKVD